MPLFFATSFSDPYTLPRSSSTSIWVSASLSLFFSNFAPIHSSLFFSQSLFPLILLFHFLYQLLSPYLSFSYQTLCQFLVLSSSNSIWVCAYLLNSIALLSSLSFSENLISSSVFLNLYFRHFFPFSISSWVPASLSFFLYFLISSYLPLFFSTSIWVPASPFLISLPALLSFFSISILVLFLVSPSFLKHYVSPFLFSFLFLNLYLSPLHSPVSLF